MMHIQIGDIITSDTQVGLLTFVVATVLPLLVGLVTKTVTWAGLKAILLALLSAAAGFGQEWLAAANAGTSYNLLNGAIVAFGTFMVAVVSHYGLWKPTGLSSTLQSVTISTKSSRSTPASEVSTTSVSEFAVQP